MKLPIKSFGIILLLINFLIFVGCKKGQNYKTLKSATFNQHEARFFDIPIPLGAVPLSYGISENSYAYFIKQKASELSLFYESEMEAFGWNKIASFSNFEILLIFIKPGKKISISIRTNKNNLDTLNVFIFLEI